MLQKLTEENTLLKSQIESIRNESITSKYINNKIELN